MLLEGQPSAAARAPGLRRSELRARRVAARTVALLAKACSNKRCRAGRDASTCTIRFDVGHSGGVDAADTGGQAGRNGGGSSRCKLGRERREGAHRLAGGCARCEEGSEEMQQSFTEIRQPPLLYAFCPKVLKGLYQSG